jgi:hypothetical protein
MAERAGRAHLARSLTDTTAMVIRCTRKLLDLLQPAVPLEDIAASEDDWYANLLWIDRRSCLLLVHAGTLFAVFRPGVRKPELRRLGEYVVGAVEAELLDEGLLPDTFGPLDAADLRLARTASRATLGFMNEMAFQIRWQAEDAGGLKRCDPHEINRWLRRVLYSKDGYAKPLELVARWTGSTDTSA